MWILENLESPGICFNIFQNWKVLEKTIGLERPANLLNSSKKIFRVCVTRKNWRIDFEILGMKEFEVKFGVLEKSVGVLRKSGKIREICF